MKTGKAKTKNRVDSECELCGCDTTYHKEYPTGERQFLPVIYEICTNKDCERSSI